MAPPLLLLLLSLLPLIIRRMRRHAFLLFVAVLFFLGGIVADVSLEYDDELQEEEEEELEEEEPHPDPNEEDYPGMIYVGRIDPETQKRVGWDHDNGVRYIFGTSFDESHREIAEQDLAHRNLTALLAQESNDIADRAHGPVKSRDEVLAERALHKNVSLQGPKPFGHVDTHPLDGGVTPPKVVRVDPFFLDAKPVTNAEYAKFVQSTYYETEAEKFGWSFVLESFVPEKNKAHNGLDHDGDGHYDVEVDPEAPHWVAVTGAYWRSPEGPGTSYRFRQHHPVVHVSHRDAAEYCTWKGKRLPGEWEWEAAARAGHYGPNNRTLFIWGEHSEEPDPSDVVMKKSDEEHAADKNWTASDADWARAARFVNIWSSTGFPHENQAQDGWRGTSPVATFPSNAAGFYDMTGNVWEWMRGGKHKSRIVRGASFVDSVDGSFNHAATLGARATLHGTTTTANVGFRCAKSAKRRVEYHYQYESSDADGTTVKPQLTVEHAHGKRDYIGGDSSSSGSSTGADDEDEFENDDGGSGTRPSRKKTKVIKRRERYSTEL